MFLNVKLCAEISSVADERAMSLHAVECLPRGHEAADAGKQRISCPDFALYSVKVVSADISPKYVGVYGFII